ncbi:Hsp20/alpha crystallin family protein [Neobacillus sp. D3-1R]|uniref:Hsp20/alpha crystallin family protein n=1 Tax=Neobacillus sp. D3-1R TaxID=3445778 RepID=UPI003FA1951A
MGKQKFHSNVKKMLGNSFSSLLSEISPFVCPRMDVFSNGDTFFILADIAGINPQNLSVKLKKNILYIEGNIEDGYFKEKSEIFLLERFYGTFQRKVLVPNNCLLNRIQTVYENGILLILIPCEKNNQN